MDGEAACRQLVWTHGKDSGGCYAERRGGVLTLGAEGAALVEGKPVSLLQLVWAEIRVDSLHGMRTSGIPGQV